MLGDVPKACDLMALPTVAMALGDEPTFAPATKPANGAGWDSACHAKPKDKAEKKVSKVLETRIWTDASFAQATARRDGERFWAGLPRLEPTVSHPDAEMIWTYGDHRPDRALMIRYADLYIQVASRRSKGPFAIPEAEILTIALDVISLLNDQAKARQAN